MKRAGALNAVPPSITSFLTCAAQRSCRQVAQLNHLSHISGGRLQFQRSIARCHLCPDLLRFLQKAMERCQGTLIYGCNASASYALQRTMRLRAGETHCAPPKEMYVQLQHGITADGSAVIQRRRREDGSVALTYDLGRKCRGARINSGVKCLPCR